MEVHLEGYEALAFTLFVLFIILVIPISIIAFVLSHIHKIRIRKKYLNSSVVKAEYQPPHDLTAAEIGYLFDAKAGNKESVATLLDLERRKIIKLDVTSVGTFNIHLASNDTDALKPHEQLIIDSIGALKDIDIKSRVLFFGFNKSLRQSLKSSGYISPNIELLGTFLAKTLIAYTVIITTLFIFFVYITKGDFISVFIISLLVFVFGFPLFFALAIVSAYINNLIAGHSGLWNKKAKAIWPEIEGYREYVRQVELDELQFESEKLKVQSKNNALPYAVALGLNTKWQERFEK